MSALKSVRGHWDRLRVEQRPISFGGELVGFAISLGDSCVFYTADPRFEVLDGKVFPDEAAVRAALFEGRGRHLMSLGADRPPLQAAS